MEKKDTNRANQISIEKKYIKGVKLIDIDTTIAEYMSEIIIPDVEENEKKIINEGKETLKKEKYVIERESKEIRNNLIISNKEKELLKKELDNINNMLS